MENENKIKKLIEEYLIGLPDETQSVLKEFDWMGKAKDIGSAHRLLEPEILSLQTEVALLLVGLTDPDYFSQNLENEIGITKEDSIKITDSVLVKILKPIQEVVEEKLKKIAVSNTQSWENNVNFIKSGGDYSSFSTKRSVPDLLEKEGGKNPLK